MKKSLIVFVEHENYDIRARVTLTLKPKSFMSHEFDIVNIMIDDVTDYETDRRITNIPEKIKKLIEYEAIMKAQNDT